VTCTRVKCANRPSEASLVQPVRLKTVAFPANGDNVAGRLRILFQLLPKPGDVNIRNGDSCRSRSGLRPFWIA
jgi:hypothetical protein